MAIEIRSISPDEVGDFLRTDNYAFGEAPGPGMLERVANTIEPDRMRCGFEDGAMISSSGGYTFDFAVPGATLPAAGTTGVAVLPTHRRRGLLRAMMREHLQDVTEHEEPIATLWAAQAGIYERFGFGPAADNHSFKIDKAQAAYAHPLEAGGRCRLVEADEAAKALPQLYEQVWRERPGHFARAAPWWENRHLWDPEWIRQGMTAFRYALYEDGGEVRGYTQYRVKSTWDDGSLPIGTVDVSEVMGRDPEARAILWRHLLDLDLMSRLDAWNQPADSELYWLLADRRQVVTTGVRDSIWLRVHEPAAALAGRRYATEGRVVLAIRDAFWPDAAGTYALEGGPDGAQCRRSTETPDLELDTADLGAVYLGGHRLSALVRAGRVHGDPAVIQKVDAMFSWHRAPWCPEIF